MFELTEILSLQSVLSQHLQSIRQDGVISPRVLGQEKDGCILYTWDSTAPYEQNGSVVTHIGIFDPSTQANRVLWINDSVIHISTCSVNLSRTLLAYTTYDTHRDKAKGVYRAYLAEIFPQKRVFSLNIERPHFIRVQFLYESDASTNQKMSHMLLFLHKESIGLYHIPLARVEKGIIMSNQPETEQLVKKFIWCQWEDQYQRLYYIVCRRVNKQGSLQSTSKPILSCLQFSQHSKYDHMLDLPLNFEFPNIKPNTRSTYLDLPLCQGIPDASINICSLSLSNGTLCICYQHAVQPTKQEMSDSDEVDMDYTVIMPHHARELQCSVSKVPWGVARSARMTFSWLNDYLMVFVPGQYIHALNVTVEFDPCQHIILHRRTWEGCSEEDKVSDCIQTNNKRVPDWEETTVKTVPIEREVLYQTEVKTVDGGTAGSLNQTEVKTVDGGTAGSLNQTEVKTVDGGTAISLNQTEVKTVDGGTAISLNQTEVKTVDGGTVKSFDQNEVKTNAGTAINKPKSKLVARGTARSGNQTEVKTVDGGTAGSLNQTEVKMVDGGTVKSLNQTEVKTVDGATAGSLNQTEVKTVDGGTAESLNQTEVKMVDGGTAGSLNQTEVKMVDGGTVKSLNQTEVKMVDGGTAGSLNQTEVKTVDGGTAGSLNQTEIKMVDGGTAGSLNQTEVKMVDGGTAGSLNQTEVKMVDGGTAGSLNQTEVKTVDGGTAGSLNQTEVKTVDGGTNVNDNQNETEMKMAVGSSEIPSVKSPAFRDMPGNVLPPKHYRSTEDVMGKLNIVTEEASHVSTLSPFYKKQSASNSSCLLYESVSGKVYQLSVNMDKLVHLFSACYMATMRQALLHYVIKQGRESNVIKQLFEMMANDCASPEVPYLMQEFLVGQTYSNMRRQVDKDVFQLLPFTITEPFRGTLEKIATNERLSRISYLSLHSTCMNIGSKSGRERQQRRVSDDLWDNLCHHLRSRQLDQPHRFSLERVHQEYKDVLRAVEKGHSPSALAQVQEKDSFLGKISARARRSISLSSSTGSPRSDNSLTSSPLFQSEDENSQDKLFNLTQRLFTAHLGKYLRKDSKIKVAHVAKEYISCQMQQSKQLCLLLWSIRGPNKPSDYIPLNQEATEQEYELFQLFERFYMAIQELAYPIPPGFHTYFSILGFRALDLSLFLQYVDRGVLQLTGEFVAQIMEDLTNDDPSSQIKLQIISRLPKALAEECFRKWDHPFAYRHTAIQQVATLLKHYDESSRGQGSFSHSIPPSPSSTGGNDDPIGEPGDIHSVFHPLDTLMELMHRAEHLHPGGPSSFDSQFIKDAATFNTTHDLRTINF